MRLAYLYGNTSTPLVQYNLTTGDVDYLHTDLLGSIRTTTNTAGAGSSDADYDTYDQPLAVTTEPVSAVTRFGYAGEYTDPTGYIYLGARYYDPTTAQFLTRDPSKPPPTTPTATPAATPSNTPTPLDLDWLDNVSNFAAGFGDTITFGGTKAARERINYALNGETDDMVNTCSTSYAWGGYTSIGIELAAGGPAAIKFIKSIRGILQVRKAAQAARSAEQAAHAAATAANTAGDTGSLYRGLAADHPGLGDAIDGIARPRGGHADAALHNGGNTASEFTSWTTDESIARGIAAEANGPGTVLRIPNADGPGYVRVPSPDIYGEAEVLIRGTVTGADVLPWGPLR